MKTIPLLLITGCTLLCLTSCGTEDRAYRYSGEFSKNTYNSGHTTDNFMSADASVMKTGGTVDGNTGGQEENTTNQKMIYNASISIVSLYPDSVRAKVVTIAKKYEGYVLYSGNTYTTIRVKSASLKDAMGDLSTLGKVKYKSISAEDVSDEYTDYAIRLENAERARKRYLELLEKAANVDETLKVEKELERLNGEIDLLKGKMNRIDHLIDYSTITVYHEEKVKLGLLGYIFVGAYDAVKWLFVRN